jgi:hypothetical protein
MAEDWEAELVKNARRLHIGAGGVENDRRVKDKEWERSGAWDTRDLAREAEDRTRRDAGREIGEWNHVA